MRLVLFCAFLCGCASSKISLPVASETLNLSVAVRCNNKEFAQLLCESIKETRIAKKVVLFSEKEASTYYLIIDVKHHPDPWQGEPSRKNSSLNFWAYLAPWLPIPAMMNILPVVTVRVRNDAKVTFGFWTSKGFVPVRKEGVKNPFVVSSGAKELRWLDRYWWTIRKWLPVSSYGRRWREIFFKADPKKVERLKKIADRSLARLIAIRVVKLLEQEKPF